MNIFIVSDIFGKTSALKRLGETLATKADKLIFVDPYSGVDHKFETERRAYSYFTNHIGHEKYQSILMDALNMYQSGDKTTILVGFSVGASAIWGISKHPPLHPIKKAICFYGSQIRHQSNIYPEFDIELIFPEKEPHFDVESLIASLKDRPRVTCKKASGLHGFMNTLSNGFDSDGYASQIIRLQTSLRRFT